MKELDDLIQESRQQAEDCAKSAVKFKHKFRILAWAGIAFVGLFTPWSIVLIIAGIESGRWVAVMGGAVILGLAAMEAWMTPYHFRHADDQFRAFMEIREKALSNLKELEELKQQDRREFGNE